MKIVINGREFDASAQPFIGDLRLLNREFGFGWGEVAKRLSGIDDSADVLAMLDDEDITDALMAWMWMARLRAGERDVTIEEIRMTPIDAFTFKTEPGDELPEDGSVPTSAPLDGRGAKPVPVPDVPKTGKQDRATKASTRTSKQRSIPA
jgi:hypothetical protein